MIWLLGAEACLFLAFCLVCEFDGWFAFGGLLTVNAVLGALVCAVKALDVLT